MLLSENIFMTIPHLRPLADVLPVDQPLHLRDDHLPHGRVLVQQLAQQVHGLGSHRAGRVAYHINIDIRLI